MDIMKFKYILKKCDRKTLEIKINKEGEVLIKAPKNITEKQIEDVLLKKSKWIENKIKEVKKRDNKVFSFENNSKLPLLGKEFPVNIVLSKNKKSFVEFLNNQFNFFIEEGFFKDESLKKKLCLELLKSFYKEYGKSYLEKKTRNFEKIIGVKCNLIKVKDVKSIWGSCSSNSNINYNLRLMLMDESLIDYIVVHELCHLIHRNHSKSFWSEVGKYVPDYEEKRERLQEVGKRYCF